MIAAVMGEPTHAPPSTVKLAANHPTFVVVIQLEICAAFKLVYINPYLRAISFHQ
jgi:hypothetical protein